MESKICQENGNSLSEYLPEFMVPLIVLHLLTAVTAILLNALVIITIWKTPSLQTPSRILLCGLALTDLLFGSTVQLVVVLFAFHALIKSFQGFCTSWAIIRRIGYSLGMVTLETLAAISIDRYLAIKTRTAYRNIVTKRRVVIFLVFAWVFAFVVVISCIQFADIETLFFTSSLNMAWLLVVISVSYAMSFYAMKILSSQVIQIQINPSLNQTLSNCQPSSNFNIWKYKRSLITMVMVLALCLLSYLPMLFYNLIYLSVVGKSVAMWHVTELVIALNSTLNPILYLWRMKDLRDAAKNTICSIW